MRALIRGPGAGLMLVAMLMAMALLAWRAGWIAQAHLALIEAQGAFQAPLAAGVRSLKSGAPGAVAGLVWLGFVYGVLHAAGPGHGKVVLGAWAFSGTATRLRVVAITLAASLAQALTAIVLVLAGTALLGLGRKDLTALAEGPVLRAGEIALIALGGLLILRGLWRLRRPGGSAARSDPAPGPDVRDHAAPGPARHDHAHPPAAHHAAHHNHADDHAHGDATCGCGHAHAPAPDLAARASLPEALMLIAGVAMRPCTGAVFVMLLCVLIGAPVAGVVAVLAMGLGTAGVTLAVALAAARLGEGVFAAAASPRLHRAAALAQIAAGVLIVALSL